MIQFSQQTYFSNNIAGDTAFGSGIRKRDSLDSYNVVRLQLATLVNNTVGPLSQHFGSVAETFDRERERRC